MRYEVGDKLFIPSEKQPYTVMARNDRYIICNRRYNKEKDLYWYFIIDLERKVRGDDDILFSKDYKTTDNCNKRLKELQEGIDEVSVRYRNFVQLDI